MLDYEHCQSKLNSAKKTAKSTDSFGEGVAKLEQAFNEVEEASHRVDQVQLIRSKNLKTGHTVAQSFRYNSFRQKTVKRDTLYGSFRLKALKQGML